MKFRECGKLLQERRLFLRMKGMVCSCVRSAMLYMEVRHGV